MRLKQYLVNHLFLLMGENPLPNWVAAMTLLERSGTVYLIHTTFTAKQANRLSQVLQAARPDIASVKFIDLTDKQADAFVIKYKIQEIAQNLKGRVGMNYTGGTKSMSVHTYRILERLYPNTVFSYLDSNTLEMCFDSDEDASERIKVEPQLSLSQLFALHGLTWRSRQPPESESVLPELAAKLARLHQDISYAKAWRAWCNRELRAQARNVYSRWRDELELQRIAPLSLQGLPEPLQVLLQSYLGATKDALSVQVASKYGFSNLTQVCEWLDGTWLENHTLAQVQSIASSISVHESKMSFRMDEPTSSTRKWEKFEFDVAFMRHYQLFALSCTTIDKRASCKQKLFEANTRARQLGGIEARVGLVCCHERPEFLKSELEVEIRNRKIAVFGRQDLATLGEKIKNWIKEND